MKNENIDGENKIIITVTTILILVVIVFAVLNTKSNTENNTSGKFDAFAQCLTDKGAVMYGAEWCPHCKEQKAAFGSSFKLIKYIECPDNTQLCIDKGIQGYPTWIIGTSTKFIEGFDKNSTMQELSDVTACVLPK